MPEKMNTGQFEPVAQQYLAYPYPEPVHDMAEAIAKGYYEYASPVLFWPLFWPEGKTLEGLRVLIAGCGTNQAAYNALVMPGATITAIDLSASSLRHAQYLKDKHSLVNLSLHRMNLLDVKRLGQSYDLIISTGVLHHLPDPDEGVKALAGVLDDDGVMSLMLYGKYARVGVNMVREAFRILGCEAQTPQDIDLLKATLSSLDERHAVMRYLHIAHDLDYDAGLVDTFLHPQERAYSVYDVMAFAENNGLAFWDWVDRGLYSPVSAIPKSHRLHQRLGSLSMPDQWAVVELLAQEHGTHRFVLTHPERARRVRKIDFNSGDWLEWIPSCRYPARITGEHDTILGTALELQRAGRTFLVHDNLIPLFKRVDGQSTVAEIIQVANASGASVSRESARSFFLNMYERGHFMYSRVKWPGNGGKTCEELLSGIGSR